MTNPTADWERVGDRFYRKIKLYDAAFDQDLELENHVIAGAPYGGAIGEPFMLFFSLVLTDSMKPYIVTRIKYMRTGAHRPPSPVSMSTAVQGNLFAVLT